MFNAIPQRLYVKPWASNPAAPGVCPSNPAAIADTPSSDLAAPTSFNLIQVVGAPNIFRNDNNTTTHAKAGPIVVIDALLTPATILLLSIFNSSALCKPALKKNTQLPNKAAIITAAPSHNPGLFIISFNSIL